MGHLLMLKKVVIRNNVNWDICPTSGSSGPNLVCLPRLEHLSTVFSHVRGELVANANLPALRTLELTDHVSDPSTTKELLAKTPKLERFSYFLVEDTDSLLWSDVDDTAHEDEWSAFATNLGGVAATLRVLKIYVDSKPPDYPERFEDPETGAWAKNASNRRGAIGSLTHLHNLTKLEIPMHVLFGYRPHGTRLRHILPPSLRKLYLRDDFAYSGDIYDAPPKLVIPALQSYLLESEPDGKVLSLQELHFKLRTSDMEDGLQIDEQHPLRRLESVARQAGVRCTVRFRVEHAASCPPSMSVLCG
ncbi:hypothetical protein CHGG_01539 [Chaetomium globosum CBS 148.51]|uniref:F-box domain-containing protein n=1 Tax=Chaetomium globosum (strain ATCC 6205 / CBS 148.51 / DSM 1962 / NBRC 6347 / NRRL 1970) TaxID=306901 RepID=Q2HE15_CHAGB|nr:uncharacterized protein CHGG_01539 [Chaetomium globosum CBS 148.51]EAQ93304.1 hypothetical protein CHGG_01539 [Chaetomium globosum CBS 148.51]